MHLAHPLGLHWDNRRVKNDVRDANVLLDMLRLDMVPEAGSLPRRCASCENWSVTGPNW